ncbi:histone-lysine N-methyltransferase SETMAR [Trichonephila clavipes]|uniref:Histone-lysine N-methyltransferase SETMAR n=1 Tax=Trichonephila clavipes TaxID=2585209 RepID=A0A8X6W1M2_TRICX|nr:histone-lysine N-methyltransferase SETMAR [Trichonephila clavipes]
MTVVHDRPRPTTTHHHYPFCQKAAVSQAGLGDCKMLFNQEDVYGEEVLTKNHCQNWFAKYCSGNFDVEDAASSGQPVEAEEDKTVKALVDANWRITTLEIPERLKLSNSIFMIRFVEWAQNEIAVVPDFHKRILFSDEAHFWLNGYVNKQNCRIWSEANPQVYVETPLHPEKLTVWCALWAGGILLQKR